MESNVGPKSRDINHIVNEACLMLIMQLMQLDIFQNDSHTGCKTFQTLIGQYVIIPVAYVPTALHT